MKKFFALLLSVMMMFTMLTPAFASEVEGDTPAGDTPETPAVVGGYTEVTPRNDTLTHTLSLTRDTDTRLDYEITYNFTVDPTPVLLTGTTDGVTAAGNAVKGYPTIESITYGPDDTFEGESKTKTKPLTVNWSDVKITQPGYYRWTVTQNVVENAPDNATGEGKVFYLFVYVYDNGNGLETVELMYPAETIPDEATDKTDRIDETYPAKVVDLTITKTVLGNQGSKEQYFQFTVTLETPSFAKLERELVYQINGTNYTINVPETAYHSATKNPESIAVNAATISFDIWLKHGQNVTINNMVYDTKYTITEGFNSGYTVTHTAENGADNNAQKVNANTITDSGLTDNATVDYTNTKNSEIPTGIDMQTGAAFAGIILAMGLMIVMFVSKRKEQAC